MSKVRKWIVFQAIVKSIVQYHVSDSQGKNDGAAGPIENPNQMDENTGMKWYNRMKMVFSTLYFSGSSNQNENDGAAGSNENPDQSNGNTGIKWSTTEKSDLLSHVF